MENVGPGYFLAANDASLWQVTVAQLSNDMGQRRDALPRTDGDFSHRHACR